MNAEQFVYWLNGFFELSDRNKLDSKQVQIIKDHLKLVFEKVTPEYRLTKEEIESDPSLHHLKLNKNYEEFWKRNPGLILKPTEPICNGFVKPETRWNLTCSLNPNLDIK